MSVRRADPSIWATVTVMGKGVHTVPVPDPDLPSPLVLNRELNKALHDAAPTGGDRGFILFEESVIPRGSRYSIDRWIRLNAGERFQLQGTKKIKVGPGGRAIPYIALSLAIFFGVSQLVDRSHA